MRRTTAPRILPEIAVSRRDPMQAENFPDAAGASRVYAKALGGKSLRTAIVHYWLVSERGGEKVVRALCDLFPDAVLFAHVADKSLTDRLFRGHEVRTSFISKLPFAERAYKAYLPLMPLALEEIDLSEFDLVISSESGPAKGVIPSPGALHICYCHSPMRYLWDQRHLYRSQANALTRFAMPFLAHYMRQWDVSAAARVDAFAANSGFVASRIRKYYRRESDVIHPPVDIERFQNAGPQKEEWRDAYLWVGQITAYKNPLAAVEAANKLRRKLIVIGDGELRDQMKARAGDTVTFLGRASDETVLQAYASCRALVFPGEEDFGITPVEAMAAGAPVIALNQGGARETVIDGATGVLYEGTTGDDLSRAMLRFEEAESGFCKDEIRAHAESFSLASFRRAMSAFLRRHGVTLANEGAAPQ